MNAQRLGRLLALGALAVSASCITVNVNFPESAVQHAADDFVKDLYKEDKAPVDNSAAATNATTDVQKSVKKTKKKKVVEPAPANPSAGSTQLRIDFGLTPVYAQEPELNMSSPKALELREKLKARGHDIGTWKRQGILCETNDGLIDILDASKAGASIGEVNKVIKLENEDRMALYKEVGRANSISDAHQDKIRKFFAASFQQHYPPACK